MLAALIELCLRHRPVVLMATLLLGLVGLSSLSRLPFDAFPDTTPVQVQINTNAPALSPLEVERQIGFSVEQAISGLPGLTQVRSIAKFGFSQVTVVFNDDTDIYLARQMVSERLASADLPDDVEAPTLGPIASGLGEVFQYVLHSETRSAEELRTLHHWVVRPQMISVPGVAEINTWGGEEKQFHVVIDPQRLIKHDLILDDVARALRQGNRNTGGGVLVQAGESQPIQGQGLVSDIADLESMVLANVDGTPIRLVDVADVRIGHEIRRGAATWQGKGEAVLGLGFMLMGENSRSLTAALEARLASVQRSLPDDVEVTEVYSRTTIVDQVLSTVRKNLLEGALLVIAVLFALMGSLRAGLIVAAAIPLSMLFAFNAMLQFGVAGSLMSLGAIDFGLVVDSSVIMVENASRRLQQEGEGRSVVEVVRDAALEVRRPTLFGELIIAAVYLPILALEGAEGKLFRPMALTVIFALLGSMLLSVTLMPVLASYGLRRKTSGQSSGQSSAQGTHEDTRLLRWLRARYRPILHRGLAHPRQVLVAAVVVVAVGAGLATRLGAEFVPRLQENAIVVNTVRIAGISLEESVRYGTAVERRLLQFFPDEIDQIWTRTGTAEVATDPMGMEVSDVFLTLKPRTQWTVAENQADLMGKVAAALSGLPGMESVLTQPIEMRLNEMDGGIRADVGIKIFGDDFEALQAAGESIQRAIGVLPGAADVTVEQLSGQAVVTVDVDREAAGRYGIPVGEILEVVEALGTMKVGEVMQGQRRFDLVLRYGTAPPASLEQLQEVRLRTDDGAQIPLSAVASIKVVDGPATIQREWAKRRLVVQANVRGRDPLSFVDDVRRVLADDITLPEGTFVAISGQFEHLERAQRRLMVVVPLAILLVLMLLYLTYGRLGDALRVFTGVPFGAVGGIVALWLRDLPFSVSAAVGFIALSGVAVLGDMVLVSRVKDLVAKGVSPQKAIADAAESRLRPVVMTSLVAALGFVPMALGTGIGAEVQRPLATVVVGGVFTATLGTLLVLPVLYGVFVGALKPTTADDVPRAGDDQ